MVGLKPCPFCGAAPNVVFGLVIQGQKTDWNFVACENEKCRIKPSTDWHKSKSVVVREWNRRCE
jgi:Lar family restriction alleviation protein